jgi:TPR repeat protein
MKVSNKVVKADHGKTGTNPRPVTAMALLEIDLPPKIDDLLSKAKLKTGKEKQALGEEYFLRGKAFEDGIEIPKQGTKDDHARSYYEAGARLGSIRAKSAIGVFHAQGRGGLPPKDKAALVEYQAAADRGDVRAIRNLALYHSTGRGDLFQDRLKAFNLLKEVRCQLVE